MQADRWKWVRFPRLLAGAVVVSLSVLCGIAWSVASVPPHQVTQKGRKFHPGQLTIKRGEVVEFVNDDGDLLHHAYLTSDKFSFDTGDQEPGSKTDVVFPATGTFTILCGIHPKMKLIVEVQ